MKDYFVYILTNFTNTTLYIGVTNNLERRVLEHKFKVQSGFTRKYKLYKLIHYETCAEIIDAIEREKQLKNWHRDWKWNLIKQTNPDLKDLWEDAEINSA